MTVPMMIAMFLNLAYNIVDSIWIGNLLGETAMAALTSSMPISLLLTSIAMGATNGFSILLSQRIGAKRDTDDLMVTSLLMAVVLPLAVTVLLEMTLPWTLAWLQTPPETMRMAHDFLAIYLIGYVADFLYLYFAAVLRSHGNTTLQAIVILLSTVMNALLDPILIGWIGFDGVAVSTLISQTAAVMVLIIYLRRKRLLSIHVSAWRADLIPQMARTSLPAIIQQSIPAVSTAVLTAIVSGFGIAAIAGYGVSGKLETLLLYPAMAFNMVLTSIVGQCIGRGRLDRARDYVRCALLAGGISVLVGSILLVMFARQLSGLFVDARPVADVVSIHFLIIGLGYVFNTLTNCLIGALNGMGRPTRGMLLMLFYYLLVRVPLSFLLSAATGSVSGVWVAVLISHVVAFASAAGVYLLSGGRTPEPARAGRG